MIHIGSNITISVSKIGVPRGGHAVQDVRDRQDGLRPVLAKSSRLRTGKK